MAEYRKRKVGALRKSVYVIAAVVLFNMSACATSDSKTTDPGSGVRSGQVTMLTNVSKVKEPEVLVYFKEVKRESDPSKTVLCPSATVFQGVVNAKEVSTGNPVAVIVDLPTGVPVNSSSDISRPSVGWSHFI